MICLIRSKENIFPLSKSSSNSIKVRVAHKVQMRRRSQVVRQRSAKPLFSGSNPLVASNKTIQGRKRHFLFRPFFMIRLLRIIIQIKQGQAGIPVQHNVSPLWGQVRSCTRKIDPPEHLENTSTYAGQQTRLIAFSVYFSGAPR